MRMKKETIRAVIRRGLVFQPNASETSHVFGAEAMKLGKFFCKAFAELCGLKSAFGHIFLESREQSAYDTSGIFLQQAAIMNKMEDFFSPFPSLKKMLRTHSFQ